MKLTHNSRKLPVFLKIYRYVYTCTFLERRIEIYNYSSPYRPLTLQYAWHTCTHELHVHLHYEFCRRKIFNLTYLGDFLSSVKISAPWSV